MGYKIGSAKLAHPLGKHTPPAYDVPIMFYVHKPTHRHGDACNHPISACNRLIPDTVDSVSYMYDTFGLHYRHVTLHTL